MLISGDIVSHGGGRWQVTAGLVLAWMISTTPLHAAEGLWRSDLAAAREEAKQANRPLLVELTATWCGACRQMQQLTLTDARVMRVLETSCIAALVDVDPHPEVVSSDGVTGFPTTLLLDPSGSVRHRWVGYQSAAEFAAELERLTAGSGRERESFPAVSALHPSNGTHSAFGGYCLVSLLEDNKLRRGEIGICTDYRGQTVCFASAAHRERFLRNPQRYWPVANGTCLVTSQEDRAEEQGDPRVGVTWRGKLWFFADRDRQQRFLRSPHRFAGDRL
jgi:YHS domain-containing protein/thiol-disulfide isomerase/thioredoxin